MAGQKLIGIAGFDLGNYEMRHGANNADLSPRFFKPGAIDAKSPRIPKRRRGGMLTITNHRTINHPHCPRFETPVA